VLAPAKVNLALHVTGRRPDGYHLIDSLVVFADLGDEVRASAAPELSLTLRGPGAADVPAGEDNLMLRAALSFGPGRGAHLVLDKHLPVAAGLGGGSSDAAAALLELARLWRLDLPPPADLLRLGADLPVCLLRRPARVGGIGERVAPLDAVPPLHAVLANPGVALPTAAVFAALERRDNPPLDPLPAPGAAFAPWLRAQRNDLEAPAQRLAPVVAEVLAALAASPGAWLVRMSGSGATCFALYPEAGAAARAAAALSAARPGWWVRAARLGAVPVGVQVMRSTT
jgi:4-diphosphocytidyl-2-C-methyl-D-erythritol kinase